MLKVTGAALAADEANIVTAPIAENAMVTKPAVNRLNLLCDIENAPLCARLAAAHMREPRKHVSGPERADLIKQPVNYANSGLLVARCKPDRQRDA